MGGGWDQGVGEGLGQTGRSDFIAGLRPAGGKSKGPLPGEAQL